ncbi:uncharacterized protein LOC113237052 [Hyposmocoma kahamanoa]|uniref:uncharacterized protein LOC113237052 n=1 Tax=Hyposmocoma kahamanoa TaxID=1477025 RepID=UPI000E6D679E|nr:uncharacterized protein LOC113237052 [Hyposmocoma kahamanoa]
MSEPAINALEKGLNFAPTPTRIPIEKVICGVEEAIVCNRVPASDAETLRQDVAIAWRHAHLPPKNMSTQELMGVKELRADTTIIVLKADKGNATVIMDAEEYDRKIKALLEDGMTYNPTARVKRQTYAIITECRSAIPVDIEKQLLRPRIVQPPRLYGLPKIHKTNVPL